MKEKTPLNEREEDLKSLEEEYNHIREDWRTTWGKQEVSCKTHSRLSCLRGYIGTGRSPYGNYEFYSWTITVPRKKRVKIHFIKFDLENHPSCKYDYWGINDGATTEYCGNKIPADYVSSSSSAFIYFKARLLRDTRSKIL
ncbi:hypothetical protein NP493_17g05013 [Ridgeia piscesae]|uniref:CUB domain-containing protein n=1 Tax=Ridgeia piscesae TaxID=27915 RepID=A0AAD9PE27_RIDPI|nr:hypothetical protein NP493_17g05013 [Ridgeia piscesae]